MKVLSYLLLLTIISLVSAQAPPTHLLTISLEIAAQPNLTIYSIITGEVINSTIIPENIGFPSGIFDVTDTEFKMLTFNLTNGDTLLYNYNYVTLEASLLGVLVEDVSYEYLITPLNYDAKSNSIYIAGTLWQHQQSEVFILSFDEPSTCTTINLPWNYSVIPTGVYDNSTGNMYIYLQDETLDDILVVFDIASQSVTANYSIPQLSDTNVYLFVAGEQLYACQYNDKHTYIQLYLVDKNSGNMKLLFQLENFYTIADNYFAYTNDYIVFLSTDKGEAKDTIFTTVSLSTYKQVSQSAAFSTYLYFDFMMGLY